MCIVSEANTMDYSYMLREQSIPCYCPIQDEKNEYERNSESAQDLCTCGQRLTVYRSGFAMSCRIQPQLWGDSISY